MSKISGEIKLIEEIGNFVMLTDEGYLCAGQLADGTPDLDDDGEINWADMMDLGSDNMGWGLEELNKLFNADVKSMSTPCPALITVKTGD